MYRSLYFLISLVFLFFIIPSFTSLFAQSGPQVQVTLSPQYPDRNEEVTVSVESSDLNLGASEITWSLNDVVKERGVGIKEFNFISGEYGTVQTITLFINPSNAANALDRRPFQEKILIRPAGVDLLWQAKAYTPPFYRGKALYPPQGEILVVAIPHIVTANKTKISQENLVYTWKENGVVIPEVSGYGRSVFPFLSPVVSQIKTITAEASSLDGVYTAQKSIVVGPTEPFIRIYENHPLYGVLYNREIIGEQTISGDEASFVAIPYFFSGINRKNNNLRYLWTINNTPITNQDTTDSVTFRKTEERSGSSNISLSIENTQKLLQSANINFSINLEK